MATLQELIQQTGATLFKGAGVTDQSGVKSPDAYRIYVPGQGAGGGIIHGIDQNSLINSGYNLSSIEDQYAASTRLGLSTYNADSPFYGIAGGESFFDINSLNNRLSSYAQNIAIKKAQDAALAQSNAALGSNIYNPASNPPAQTTPQTQTQASVIGGTQPAQTTVNPPTTILQPGSTGDAVKQLQDYLVKQGLMTQTQVNTGYGTYGPQTTAAVLALQQKLGIDYSSGPGYFGPKTLAALQQSGSASAPLTSNPLTTSLPTAPPTSQPTTGIPTTGITTPNFPQQTSTQVQTTYLAGLTQSLTTAQANLDAERTRQLTTIQTDKANAQKELDDIRSKQEAGIASQGTVALEEKQKILDQLKIEEDRFNTNYNIVQGLNTQLTDLMTKGNALIEQEKGVTGLASIRNPRIDQTINSIVAQTAVIRAGIDGANGQMTSARAQLVDATNVITTAYTDQLTYYKTLNDFYDGKAKDSNSKLTTLTSDERTFLDTTITNLQNKVAQAQKNSDYIQSLMTSPTTALFMSQAGVSLSDTPDQVNAKMAAQTKRQDVIDTTNAYVKDGYTPSAMPGPNTVPVQAGGQTIYFTRPVSKTASVQEYEYAKANGYTGSYSQYQADDANRKNPPQTSQDTLEQQYRQILIKEVSNRSGTLGTEDAKVAQANHLNSIFEQYKQKDGTYNIPKAQYGELALGLASLMSKTGTPTDSVVQSITQKTLAGDIAGAITYALGTPVTGSTQAIFQQMKDSIDRQAKVAISNREAAIQFIRGLAPTGLEQARRDALEKNTLVPYNGATNTLTPGTGLYNW